VDFNRREGVFAWLFVVVLVAATISLAAMQFRWIGQLSDGERERMRRGLESSLNAFARDWNWMAGDAAEALNPEEVAGGDPALLLRWKRLPPEGRIFRRVVKVVPKDRVMFLMELDLERGISRETSRPPEWKNLLSQFEERIRLGEEAPRGPVRVVEPDLVEMPIWGEGSGPDRDGRQPEAWVIFQLDMDLLRGKVFPELEQRYVNTEGSADYVLRIAARGASGFIYQTPDARVSNPGQAADARIDLDMGGRGGRRGGRGRGRWELTVQHRAGSVEDYVAQSRMRNLTVTAGLLVLMLVMIAALWRFTRKAQQLAELQMEFVAGISHELRTPLTVIRTAAYNLSNGVVRLDNQMQFQRYGSMILTQTDKLTGMVEQVLRFASVQAGRVIGKREWLPVEKLVKDAVASCQFLLDEADAHLETQIAEGLPPLLADPQALQHALQNLVSNAAKYGPRGGKILLQTDQHGTMLRFRVLDQGPGIAPGELEKIFVPFFRGKGAVEEQIHGTGLGLSLVKRIVEAHGGKASARNVEGAGAEFSIEIPVEEGANDEFTNSAG
jgi:signal transduction histidine kinase